MGPASRFAVIGVNHRCASLTLRDALFVDDVQAAPFLGALKLAGLEEALVLSTCDRVEVWTATTDAAQAAATVARCLAARAPIEADALAGQLYTLDGEAAVRHAFAVTAALDSLIIGEPHVTGQVKAAHRLARDGGTLAAEVDAVVQAAQAAAKRVRNETAIGAGPVSIASAAVQLARDLHGNLARCRCLLIGTGDMGELVAESLLAADIGWLAVTAPRAARAESLAKQLACHVVPFESFRDTLAEADIVLSALGGREVLLTAHLMAATLKKRRRKPVFIVDAAIPGDVEPAVNRLDGAFPYDLNDLERVAQEGRAGREHSARAAWAIIDDEVAAFLKGRAARAAVPAIVALRDHFEAARAGALAEAPDDAAEATRLLINRLLHAPNESMKSCAAEGPEWRTLEKALRTLFKLED